MRALAFVLLLGACTPSSVADDDSNGPDVRHNVLWLTIDTLRADHLSSYGYERATSPNIDALAADGMRFDRAYATAPWTLPSVASMLTGRTPSSHQVTNIDRMFPRRFESIPRRFLRAGYRTAAVVSNKVVSRRARFHEHFQLFDDNQAKDTEYVSTPGLATSIDRHLTKFAESGEPFFLFALFFDPHYEYAVHEGFGFAVENESSLGGSEPYRALRRRADSMTPADRDRLTGLYDDEIAFTDAGIGRLVERLAELGLAENTFVVVTADHGEELLERGWFGHTISLYDELVRVPLVVRGPGVAAEISDVPVSLRELGPALLELATGAEPATTLGALLRGESPADPAPVLVEVDFEDLRDGEIEAHLTGLVADGHKLVRNDDDGSLALFDLTADPLETNDVASERPDLVRELAAKLDAVRAELTADALEIDRREIGRREIDELEAMGYVGDEPEGGN